MLYQEDDKAVPMKENCTRAEAELIAKSCVAGRLNLFNEYGAGLAVVNCFDAVLRDPGRSVYLRRSPEVVNHEIVLSNTSVVVQSISSQITQPQIQAGSVPTSIITPALAQANQARITREADMMPISSTSKLIRRKGPAEIPAEVTENGKRRKVRHAQDNFATEVMQVIRSQPVYSATLMSCRTLQRISMSILKKLYPLYSRKKTAD
jgi:hypothetical protein